MSQQKILIVDDDKDVVKGLTLRLKAYGYSVHSASDAVTAVSIARQVDPDLVLLDLGLPGGDGFKVMERLDALPATMAIPVIVITARDAAEMQKKAIHAGAAGFLQKPVDNEALLAHIQRAIGTGAMA